MSELIDWMCRLKSKWQRWRHPHKATDTQAIIGIDKDAFITPLQLGHAKRELVVAQAEIIRRLDAIEKHLGIKSNKRG